MRTCVRAAVPADWSGLDATYGGYVVARAVDAMECVEGFGVLSAAVGFIGRVQPGAVDLSVEIQHRGSRTATVAATLAQGHPRVTATAKLGLRLGGSRTPRIDVKDLVGPSELEALPAPYGSVPFDIHVEARQLPPPTGDPSSSFRAWVRVASPPSGVERLGSAGLPAVFMDRLPPGTWFDEAFDGFAPTIDFTLHLGSTYATYDSWHLVEQYATARGDDFWVEDASLHDADGELVAVSRQTRRVSRIVAT